MHSQTASLALLLSLLQSPSRALLGQAVRMACRSAMKSHIHQSDIDFDDLSKFSARVEDGELRDGSMDSHGAGKGSVRGRVDKAEMFGDGAKEVAPSMGCMLGLGACGGETSGGRSSGIESTEGALGGGGSRKDDVTGKIKMIVLDELKVEVGSYILGLAYNTKRFCTCHILSHVVETIEVKIGVGSCTSDIPYISRQRQYAKSCKWADIFLSVNGHTAPICKQKHDSLCTKKRSIVQSMLVHAESFQHNQGQLSALVAPAASVGIAEIDDAKAATTAKTIAEERRIIYMCSASKVHQQSGVGLLGVRISNKPSAWYQKHLTSRSHDVSVLKYYSVKTKPQRDVPKQQISDLILRLTLTKRTPSHLNQISESVMPFTRLDRSSSGASVGFAHIPFLRGLMMSEPWILVPDLAYFHFLLNWLETRQLWTILTQLPFDCRRAQPVR
ncbi:uncharacterized protein BJ212DRAFT_1303686 [Suillus subaureus]|uniref:Uncharacterized protein n=1 Tax=Suillus subaureus TaxID=48587 RepID=A0A9P7J7Z4_9AGAM|nr:uncharacterized protein BJ212DRAFT_1303686 [Suillus subaureus]KAG1807046.1 hypothetical protein BJ212DRAFT_1303686 [Suillus subaureus]